MTTCPKCREEVGGDLVAQLTKEATVIFRVTPTEGQLLDAKTVGGTLSAFVGLMAVTGKAVGVTTTTLVKSITTDADGAVEFTLVSVRTAKGLKGDAQ